MTKPVAILSRVDRVIATALALIWIAASLSASWIGLRHRLWPVLIIGPAGLWYGLLWAAAARKGRGLDWRESIRPWRRP
jgi:hypothetical protein